MSLYLCLFFFISQIINFISEFFIFFFKNYIHYEVLDIRLITGGFSGLIFFFYALFTKKSIFTKKFYRFLLYLFIFFLCNFFLCLLISKFQDDYGLNQDTNYFYNIFFNIDSADSLSFSLISIFLGLIYMAIYIFKNSWKNRNRSIEKIILSLYLIFNSIKVISFLIAIGSFIALLYKFQKSDSSVENSEDLYCNNSNFESISTKEILKDDNFSLSFSNAFTLFLLYNFPYGHIWIFIIGFYYVQNKNLENSTWYTLTSLSFLNSVFFLFKFIFFFQFLLVVPENSLILKHFPGSEFFLVLPFSLIIIIYFLKKFLKNEKSIKFFILFIFYILIFFFIILPPLVSYFK